MRVSSTPQLLLRILLQPRKKPTEDGENYGTAASPRTLAAYQMLKFPHMNNLCANCQRLAAVFSLASGPEGTFVRLVTFVVLYTKANILESNTEKL